MRGTTPWVLGALLLFASGCTAQSAKPRQEVDPALAQYVLSKPPVMAHRRFIDFGGKVQLLGYDLEPEGPFPPGSTFKIRLYWKSVSELGPGWQLFTHVVDGAGARILNVDNVGPLRRMQGHEQALPPSSWEAGKVYVDEQQFTLPRKLKTSKAVVTVGIWKGNSRLPITGGPKDGENRGQVVTIETTPSEGGDEKVGKKATRVPEVRIDKLEKGSSIKIDGKLDEEAWKTAPKLGPFVDVRTGKPNKTFPVGGSVQLAWDDKGIYFGFDVTDPDIVADFDKNAKDPHLWEKDTVEIMIDPDGDGDGRDYYEIQINPQNLVFDSRFDTYNQPKKLPDGPFGHQDWSAKLKSAVTIKGTIGKSEDKDEGYLVEAMVPWSSFDKAEKTPPEIGQSWRMNFYAMQNNSGVAWSPILAQGNFHRASRFGKVVWADKTWTPTATADDTVTADGTQPPSTATPAAADKPTRPTAADKTAKPAIPKSLKTAPPGPPSGVKMEMAPAVEQRQSAKP
jgi:hypothetical protein